MLNNAALYYVQTNLICIFVLLAIVFMKHKKNGNYDTEGIIFISIVVATIFYCILDTISGVLRGASFKGARAILYTSNGLYIAWPLLITFFWTSYVNARISGKSLVRTWYGKLLALPLVVFFLMTVLSFKNEFAFTLDSNNLYHREIGAYLIPAVAFTYLGVIEMILFVRYSTAQSIQVKDTCKSLMLFVVPPILMTGFQVVFYGVSASQVGMTLAVTLIHLSSQNNQIMIDELTGLGNRRSIMHFIDKRIDDDTVESIFMCLIDIDSFKKINDRFGHLEGDNALKEIAFILQKACRNYGNRVTIGRFGGDEFVILGVGVASDEVNSIVDDVYRLIEERNNQEDIKYKIDISMGRAAGLSSEFKDRKEFFEEADNDMYNCKKKKNLVQGV